MGGAPAPGVATTSANGFLSITPAAPANGETGGTGGMLPLTGGVRGKGADGEAGK